MPARELFGNQWWSVVIFVNHSCCCLLNQSVIEFIVTRYNVTTPPRYCYPFVTCYPPFLFHCSLLHFSFACYSVVDDDDAVIIEIERVIKIVTVISPFGLLKFIVKIQLLLFLFLFVKNYQLRCQPQKTIAKFLNTFIVIVSVLFCFYFR